MVYNSATAHSEHQYDLQRQRPGWIITKKYFFGKKQNVDFLSTKCKYKIFHDQVGHNLYCYAFVIYDAK